MRKRLELFVWRRIIWWLGIKCYYIFPRASVRYAKEYFKDKRVVAVEIGVWRGENAKSMCKELNINTLHCIDPYVDYDNPKADGMLSEAENLAHKRLRGEPVVFVKKRSDEAHTNLSFGSVDFVYVDGDHTYEVVLKDMLLYWGLVKEGGIMAGHDAYFWSVQLALHEFKKVHPDCVVQYCQEDWWITKK